MQDQEVKQHQHKPVASRRKHASALGVLHTKL